MTSSLLYSSFLVLHLMGLTIMAGTTLIDAVGFTSYWKLYASDKQKSDGVLQLLAKLGRPVGIGAALLVITGLGMMVLTHGAYGEQIWFRIKFALVLLLIANSLLLGRRQTNTLVKFVDKELPGTSLQIEKIRKNLGIFHVTQLLIFFIIIFLSVYKFN